MMAVNNSNLPTIQTFKIENYPGAPDFFRNFLQSLNLFVDPVYQVLNGGVSYQNLTIPKLFTKTITSPATGDTTFSFTNPLRITPSCVVLGNVYEDGDPSAHPTDATCVYWHFSQGTIYVDNIPNLTAATTYVITLAVF